MAPSDVAALTPAISNGITSSPSSATIQRMGRMKRGPFLPPVQYMVFGHCSARMAAGSVSARISRAARPGILLRSLEVVARLAQVDAGSAPCFLQSPQPPCSPAAMGGPLTTCSRIGRAFRQFAVARTTKPSRCRIHLRSVAPSRSSLSQVAPARRGSSSAGFLRYRFRAGSAHAASSAGTLLIDHILRRAHCQITHALNHADALGDAKSRRAHPAD